jgi:dihydrolipoamide dehydrogenase
MKTLQVDVAVIGAGTAGLAAYRAAVAQGARTVLIEGGPYGTTCARVGCMPSKLLIAAAESAHAARHAEPFGVRIEGRVVVDGRAVMARVKAERDRFVGFVLEGVASIPEQDKLVGYARFVDKTTLQVGDHSRVQARSVVIATGSSPVVGPAFQALGDRLVVNDHVFDWDDLPSSVAVFGPGVIGLELGQALSRLGVRVRVFGASGSVGPLTDPAVRASALEAFQSEFALDPAARVESMERDGDTVAIRYLDPAGESRLEHFDYVLSATGRRPQLDGLALEHAGLELDARGVPHFDPVTLRCGESSVFLAGDANSVLPLLHEAADEGRGAGENAARLPDVRPVTRSAPIAVVFSDPQIMMVGKRFSELKSDEIVVGEVSFANQGRSRVMLQNRGLLHVYAERGSGRFLGAEMVGPRAEHLAHLLAWSVQQGLTIAQMLAMPFYHPVIEEGLRTALRDAEARLRG